MSECAIGAGFFCPMDLGKAVRRSVMYYMTPEQFQDLLKRYRKGRCTPEERKLVDEWYAGIFSHADPLSRIDEETLKRESWHAIENLIDPKIRRLTFARGYWRLSGIAAAILVIVTVGYFWFFQQETTKGIIDGVDVPGSGSVVLSADGAASVFHVLPDGSTVELLPGSVLTLVGSFGESKREVFLEGEAFFDIARDVNRPFLVYTNGLTAEVLGTSFLISAYKDQEEIVVAVRTGKVSVYANSGDGSQDKGPLNQMILSSNQQVIYNPAGHIALKKLVNEPQVILPEPTLKHTYTNAPVIEILESLKANYGIDISYDATVLSNCTLTSDMSEEGFYEQIKIICNALGARYEITEDAVVIQATACAPR